MIMLTSRRQTIRLARKIARLDARDICDLYEYKRPLYDDVVDGWLRCALFYAQVPARWNSVFKREYRRTLRRVVALIDRRGWPSLRPSMIACDALPDPNSERVKAGDLATTAGSRTVYAAAYTDDTMRRRAWVPVGDAESSR